MNIPTIILNALSCAMTITIPTVAVIEANTTPPLPEPTEVVIESEQETVVKEPEKTAEIVEAPVEESSVATNAASQTTTASTPQASSSNQNVYVGNPSSPNVIEQFTSNGVPRTDQAKNYREEYMNRMEHTCPSQRPSQEYPFEKEYISALPIIGLSLVNNYYGTAEAYKDMVKIAWDSTVIHLYPGDGRYLGSATSLGMAGVYPLLGGCSEVAFYMNYSTLTVYWDAPTRVGDFAAQADDLANKMTQHLRWLDSAFKSRCPNG